MDRCALFVDAGYVLADGAMAVHGTRRRDSVSWDYPGLLKLLGGLARDRTGLPLLRCYWYEATLEGRRAPEHDVLADLPGLKLRLGRRRPGHREGVETEIHRDLITLARNTAVRDAVIVSAEEDLAQVIAEVQDLGVRVTLLHITVDGTWTVSRPLRQECDDVVEISGAHLRPFVDLISGAEPAGLDDYYPNGGYPARTVANGHGSNLGALTHQGLPAAALPPGPGGYDRGARGGSHAQRPGSNGAHAHAHAQAQQDSGLSRPRDAESGGTRAQAPGRTGGLHEQAQGGSEMSYLPPDAAPRPAQRGTGEPSGAVPSMIGDHGGYQRPDPLAGPVPGQARDVTARAAQQPPAVPGRELTGGNGQQYRPAPAAGFGGGVASQPQAQYSAPLSGASSGQLYSPAVQAQGPYSGPQAVATPAQVPQPVTVSLTDAVRAAHAEGFGFGESVAQDAPALWLEAVLARKPRMPSDLEGRLLQGSALPIDSLLHDEVRHALRRGFWDALERSRR